MDIVRVLSAADLEVRRKTLTLVMDLVSSRNIDEVSYSVCHCHGISLVVVQVVLVLKKEVANSSSPSETEEKDVSKYRQSLVKTLHACSLQFSSVAPTVVPLVSLLNSVYYLLLLVFIQLLDFLTNGDKHTADFVLTFVREAIMRYPNLRCAVLGRLTEVFGSIKSVDVHRSVMWMLGEFSCSIEEISRVMVEIRAALGEVGSLFYSCWIVLMH